MESVRFKVGDVVKIEKYTDFDTEGEQEGIILITAWSLPTVNSQKGTYSMEIIQGTFRSVAYSAYYFDTLPYIYLIGNIYESPSLKILYGTKGE